MKKVVSIITLIILIMISTVSMAADASLNISFDNSKVEAGDEIKTSLTVKDFTRDGDNKAIELKLSYDTTKLEYKSISWKNSWTGTISSDKTGVVASKTGEVSSSETVAEITFKVKESTAVGNISISASDIVTSADGDELQSANASGSFEVVKLSSPTQGDNGNNNNNNNNNGNNGGSNNAGSQNQGTNKPEENKPASQNPTTQEPATSQQPSAGTSGGTSGGTEKAKTSSGTKDNTIIDKGLPKTGASDYTIEIGVVMLVIGAYLYIRYSQKKKI